MAMQRALFKIQPNVEIAPLARAEVEPGPEALDKAIINGLKELREPGQPDPLAELTELFFKDARPRLEAMAAAAGAGDLAKLGAIAHTLKGSASNLGARRLSALCATLEKQAKTGDLEGARRTLAEVLPEFATVEKILNDELRS
jgi:histidine-containing phosphotransfer protein